MKKLLFSLLAVCGGFAATASAQETHYQRPPQIIEKVAMAPLAPVRLVSDDNRWILQLERPRYRSIAKLAQPELKLAGVRINPLTFGRSRQPEYEGITILEAATGKEKEVTGFPPSAIVTNAYFSPDCSRVALVVDEGKGLYLYSFTPEACIARRMSDRRLNTTTRPQVEWINEGELITLLVPSSTGSAPQQPEVPSGPVIQNSGGEIVPARTFQNLLKNPYEESLFDHYFTAQPARIGSGGVTEIGSPGIYSGLSLSPDRQWLLVSAVHRPYSYQVPMYSFPQRYAVWDLQGKECKQLADNPTVVEPMGYDVCSPYPRDFGWRADKPATVYWVEAQDKGGASPDKAAHKDIVYQWSLPFADSPTEVTATTGRFNSIYWRNDRFALVREVSEANHNIKWWKLEPGSGKPMQKVFDYSMDDSYSNPGYPVMVKNEYGTPVVYSDKSGNELLLTARGASPEGDMPYLSRYRIKEKKNDILWRCQAPYYESIEKVTDPARLQVLTSRQSKTEPANLFRRNLKQNRSTQLTHFANPYPEMEGVSKEKIHYKRADGLDLTATVYLPAGYDKARDGRLPVLMWAYPREFRTRADAGQVRGSQYTFTNIGNGSPVFWVLRGFCVMESVEMPIVGTSEMAEPNDNFLEQLIMNAEAAVQAIDAMGVGDKNRVAVGGHSYGAFMTANLLTHTRLFKAGIARSGAYNRTLTPFGFQSETRTYWEVPEVYYTMSPFSFAHQLSGALLLIHGDMDNNTGTFPVQTERFFQALKGHGATARYLSLPYESHSYNARENVLHLLYECDRWLEKYVK